MTVLLGKGVSDGIAVGRTHFLHRRIGTVASDCTGSPEDEWARYLSARTEAKKELDMLYDRARNEIGDEGAAIFEIHGMMIEDEDYNRAIEQGIFGDGENAERAVMAVGERFATTFSLMDDPYMRARAADVRDVSERIGRILSGASPTFAIEDTDSRIILCAKDLSPSETMQLDRSRIAAFVTAEGAVNSHTAILARSLGIPAIVGLGDALMRLADGMSVAVDGALGAFYVSPDGKMLDDLLARLEGARCERERLESYRGLDAVTRDGRRIALFANAQSLGEVEAARAQDADGIGLFRSEFLYLDRDSPPNEEEQLAAYREVLRAMQDKKVIIRTLDVGADKQAAYFHLPHEENPALGLRGVRLSLCRPELLRTQLRALLRASVHGRLGIMFPMIVSVRELDELLTFYARVRRELVNEGRQISDDVEIGIMIETPAAALIASKLAPLVDFFSVGTNDLSQYTLAIDRQNSSTLRFFDEHHEAVLRLISMAAEAAHAHGRWIGICGELGGDARLTETFLRMGIDELSVAPSRILELRAHVCALDLTQN